MVGIKGHSCPWDRSPRDLVAQYSTWERISRLRRCLPRPSCDRHRSSRRGLRQARDFFIGCGSGLETHSWSAAARPRCLGPASDQRGSKRCCSQGELCLRAAQQEPACTQIHRPQLGRTEHHPRQMRAFDHRHQRSLDLRHEWAYGRSDPAPVRVFRGGRTRSRPLVAGSLEHRRARWLHGRSGCGWSAANR